MPFWSRGQSPWNEMQSLSLWCHQSIQEWSSDHQSPKYFTQHVLSWVLMQTSANISEFPWSSICSKVMWMLLHLLTHRKLEGYCEMLVWMAVTVPQTWLQYLSIYRAGTRRVHTKETNMSSLVMWRHSSEWTKWNGNEKSREFLWSSD